MPRYSASTPKNNRVRSDDLVLDLSALTWQQFSGSTNIGVVSDSEMGNVIGFTRPTGTGTARIYANITPTDFTQHRGIGCYIKFPAISDAASVDLNLSVYLVNSVTNFYAQLSFGGGKYKEGWVYYGKDLTDLVISGAVDLTAVDRIWLYAVNGVTPTAPSDTVAFGKLIKHAGSMTSLCIIHDDGNESDYDYLYTMCAARGLKGCSSIVTNHATTNAQIIPAATAGTGFLSLEQMNEMYSSGVIEFLNHTKNGNSLNPALTNPITGSGLTEAQQEEQITHTRDFLRSNYPSGADYLIYPGGWHDHNLIHLMQTVGVQIGRRAGGSYTLRDYYVSSLTKDNGLFFIGTITIAEGNTVQNVKDAIDEAIRQRVNLIVVYGHGINIVATTPPTGLSIHATDYGLILDHIKLRQDQGLITNRLLSNWYYSL